MFVSARRPRGISVPAWTVAICLAIAVGGGSGAVAQDDAVPHALGDLWRGEAPEPSWSGEQAATGYALRSKRHKSFMQGGVPPEYRNARSPYPAADMLLPEGGGLYAAACAICHGPEGFGDGEAAMDLRLPPAFLAYMIESPDLIDQYLMWTIAEGGTEFGSSMPAYKTFLTNREIWKIVAYMRAGFPDQPRQ
jgi:mono/diheme cytochrome c family protein